MTSSDIEGVGISANRHLDHSSSAAVISQETEGEKKKSYTLRLHVISCQATPHVLIHLH